MQYSHKIFLTVCRSPCENVVSSSTHPSTTAAGTSSTSISPLNSPAIFTNGTSKNNLPSPNGNNHIANVGADLLAWCSAKFLKFCVLLVGLIDCCQKIWLVF